MCSESVAMCNECCGQDTLWCRKILSCVWFDLSWLPVPQRIRYKLCLTVFKVIHGLVPAYLSELSENVIDSFTTRSSAHGDFKIQRTRTKFRGRAFAVAGPAAWNSLTCSIRNSPTLNSFKTALKTFVF